MPPDYDAWWLHKYTDEGKRIARVHWIGSPSMVYGFVECICDDGSKYDPHCGEAFKPRKTDLAVFDTPNPTKPCWLFHKRRKECRFTGHPLCRYRISGMCSLASFSCENPEGCSMHDHAKPHPQECGDCTMLKCRGIK